MIFIETSIFTKEIHRLLPDDDYRELQHALLIHPDSGAIIPASNGLRKMRWTIPGKGKRGGLRVIYYWDVAQEKFYMLLPYRKSEKEDLSKDQIKILSQLVKEWLQ